MMPNSTGTDYRNVPPSDMYAAVALSMVTGLLSLVAVLFLVWAIYKDRTRLRWAPLPPHHIGLKARISRRGHIEILSTIFMVDLLSALKHVVDGVWSLSYGASSAYLLSDGYSNSIHCTLFGIYEVFDTISRCLLGTLYWIYVARIVFRELDLTESTQALVHMRWLYRFAIVISVVVAIVCWQPAQIIQGPEDAPWCYIASLQYRIGVAYFWYVCQCILGIRVAFFGPSRLAQRGHPVDDQKMVRRRTLILVPEAVAAVLIAFFRIGFDADGHNYPRAYLVVASGALLPLRAAYDVFVFFFSEGNFLASVTTNPAADDSGSFTTALAQIVDNDATVEDSGALLTGSPRALR
jgi:hypothetical protein